MKVLYVSDSLGAPIPQRGIHNFSMSFIEVLQDLGAKIDLVVERPPSRWLPGRMQSKVVNLNQMRKSIAIAEVFRFFGLRRYDTGWINRVAERRLLPGFLKKLAGHAYVAFVRARAGARVTVENDPALVDFVPANAWHLTMPDNFVVVPAVYTEMVLRAAWGLPPDVIDASGYDLMVVDTPMHFRVKGIDSRKIISVVHDIIPLRDPMMTPFWRSLFLRKIEGVLAMHPNFAFVSEYSRSIFQQTFPQYNMRSSFILYPTLRKSVVRRAAAAAEKVQAPFAPSGLNNLEASIRFQDQMDETRKFRNEVEERIATTARFQREAKLNDAYLSTGWDTRLPYFVTVVSDEPRKNIELLVKAFQSLKGKANMVVLGNVDGRRYVGDNPDALGHIRFTGYITEGEKTRIVAMSCGMIFPSFTEGFGIPITEGAAFSKPVLCSDIEVFREVAGDEAFYFDPYREDTLAAAVEAVIASPEESRERAERLRERVLREFTVGATTQRVRTFLESAGLLTLAAPAQRGAAPEFASRASSVG